MLRPAIRLELQDWAYRRPFVISRGMLEAQTVIYACIDTPEGPCHGEGEPHESDGAVAQAMLARGRHFVAGLDVLPSREDLRRRLPADGLRNALDALLWDVESKRAGRRAWDLAGLDGVDQHTQVPTMVTLTLDSPEAMASAALAWPGAPIVKIKLGDRAPGGLARDIERAHAVAAAAPQAELVVDANEGWSRRDLDRFVDATRTLSICLVEQPVPVGAEAALEGWRGSVPLAADESCTTIDSLPALRGRVQYVNLKLDKTGGLTEALAMVDEARRMGFGVMLGCNCGTSLAMASAFVVATQCDLVDLDGPLHLRGDRQPSINYQGLRLTAPDRALWG